MEQTDNTTWPWGWRNDCDPIHDLAEHFNIAAFADEYLAGKRTGTRYNHRLVMQHGGDTLHVIFSYRNTSERECDYKKCRVILKGEKDTGFDLVEGWSDEHGYKTHGLAITSDADRPAAERIVDALDFVTLSSRTIREHVE